MKDEILITGGAGFIGSHLGNKLKEEGHQVHGIDSYLHASKNPLTFECERGDIRWADLILMRAKNADTIIHLAAAINVDWSQVAPDLAFDINVEGTMNVLEAARKLDKKVIYASSSEVYGTHQDTRCFDGTWHGYDTMAEDHPLDGQSPYAASKVAGDRMCKAWADTYGMNINVVRLFNTYGPYQADDGYGGVIAKFTRLAYQGKAMPVFGDGAQRRDYLWIDDAVDAYVLALRTRFTGPVNFGTGTTVSVLDIAQQIGEAVRPGMWSYTKETPRKGEVDLLRCDWTKAANLGWKPTVSWKEGLTSYINWAAP